MLDDLAKNSLISCSEIALKEGKQLWLVGGFIRDSLSGLAKDQKDLDLVMEGDYCSFIEKAASFFQCEYKVFPQFLTAKFIDLPGFLELDIASMRAETYHCPGALPSVVSADFSADVQRRDFTINAIYLKLDDFIKSNFEVKKELLVDKLLGLQDLENKLIRVLHSESFIEDPTRLFRAIRYSQKIDANFDTETQRLFNNALQSHALESISRQRIINEIRKACTEKCWQAVFKAFAVSGLLIEAGLLQENSLNRFLDCVNNNSDLEPFDFVCYTLYQLNPDKHLFASFGFGKRFFKAAEKNFLE
jgi:tRNA nucleotidyltransferase (CCA-adding enzyme)